MERQDVSLYAKERKATRSRSGKLRIGYFINRIPGSLSRPVREFVMPLLSGVLTPCFIGVGVSTGAAIAECDVLLARHRLLCSMPRTCY